MSQSDEARTLRRRHDALAPEAERIDAEFPQGTPALLLKTVTVGTYPTSASSYFACNRVTPGGTESEGAAPSLTVRTGTLYALNLGSTVPASGTYVVASLLEGRWVFRHDG
jgi:hypothetical protein